MDANPRIAALLALFLVILPSCSTYQARQAIESRQKEFALNNEAWQVARLRLKSMCPKPPQSVEKYRQGQTIAKLAGEFPFRGCNIRMVKTTNAPRFDDWQWDWLPSYQTIVTVHEEELRKRVIPKLYEEYMLGLSRYLALKADQGEITPRQLAYAFNTGWKWMLDKMKEEIILLQQNLQAAQIADAAAWNTVAIIAAGLATVTTAALVAAAVSAPAPAPTTCYAHPRPGGHYYIECY